MKRLPEVTLGLISLAMVVVSSCSTAPPPTTPDVVYIADFELEAAHMQRSGPGSAPQPVPLSQSLGYGRPRIGRTPEQQARDLVDLMSRSLLEDLQQAGIPAQRLPAGAPVPSSGWLVRGAFLDLDADGRLRQTVNFGAGSMQEVVAAIDQLHAGSPRPLYTIDSAAESGNVPGPVVTLDPTLVLGRFVLSRRELAGNVKQTAEQIADQVKMRIAAGPSQTSETR